MFPGPYGAVKPEIPLPLLYLSSILRKHGHTSEIFDMRLQDYRDYVLDDTMCVGITSMTGSMIKYGLEFAKIVRAYDPRVSIIWGGVHPSLLPEQTVRNTYVDFVVRGEGEMTLLELVQALKGNGSIKQIKGITFEEDGLIINNPNREYMNLNEIPIELPYDLIEMDKYDLSTFPIHTSRGCPHQCTFCYNLAYNRCSFRYKTAERVLDEIEYVLRNFSIHAISFTWEDNFFANKERVAKICRGMIARKFDIQWDAFCRFDYASRFDDDFFELLEDSGCRMLSFGGESGSQEILNNVIHKGTKIEQIFKVTKRMSKTRIKQIISFMTGVPGESYEHLQKTLDLIDRLAQINPKAEFNGLFFFTPYPGTDLMKLVEEKYGFQPPKSLEEWQDYRIYRDVGCVWLEKKRAKMLKYLSIMTRFPFYTDTPNVPERFNSFGYKQAYLFFSRLARFRWKHRFFKFPIEWWLLEKILERFRGYV